MSLIMGSQNKSIKLWEVVGLDLCNKTKNTKQNTTYTKSWRTLTIQEQLLSGVMDAKHIPKISDVHDQKLAD